MEKSQVSTKPLLHNFPLSSLKWGKDYHNNYMRSDRSPPCPPPPPPQTPSCDDDRRIISTCSDADGDGGEKERVNAVVVFTERGGEKVSKSGACEAKNRTGCLASSLSRGVVKEGMKEELNGEMSAADRVQKQRSLRPRRAAVLKGKSDSMNVESQEKPCGSVVQQVEEINVAKSTRPRRIAADFEGVQKERKPRVWISLSKDEIEEDIFIMTGSKPSRKPKKWSKPVQTKLDNSFPGSAFVGISVEEYRRPDAMFKW